MFLTNYIIVGAHLSVSLKDFQLVEAYIYITGRLIRQSRSEVTEMMSHEI